MKYRENVVVSLHPHNDRGCGVADSELGILAGLTALRNVVRKRGNAPECGYITLADEYVCAGVDPELNFENMPDICEKYEEYTGMQIDARSPYSGSLVFAAFSGSHQDAIAKGMKWIEEKDTGPAGRFHICRSTLRILAGITMRM